MKEVKKEGRSGCRMGGMKEDKRDIATEFNPQGTRSWELSLAL